MAKKEKKELVKVEPTKALSPFQEMEKRFEDFSRRPFSLLPSWWPRLRLPEIEEVPPSMDIFTEGDDVVVKAELPGMKKEDIDVSLTKDTISISGEKKKEEKVEKKDYYSLEPMVLSNVHSVCLQRSRRKRHLQNSKMGYWR